MMLLDNLALDQLHCATYGLHITVMVNKSVAGRLLMKLYKISWHGFHT